MVAYFDGKVVWKEVVMVIYRIFVLNGFVPAVVNIVAVYDVYEFCILGKYIISFLKYSRISFCDVFSSEMIILSG